MQNHILARAVVAVGALVTGFALAAMPATAAPVSAVPTAHGITATHQQAAVGSAYSLRCTVTGSNVNYRRGPGMQYASYGQVGGGFTFASSGAVPDPRGRYFYYWDIMRRPGHADAYINDQYVSCWVA